MIELTNITKSYKDGRERLSILQHVNLHISEGEFIAILGPSGSGKSTLLNILGLLDRPSSGTYQLDGKDITTYSQARLANVRNRQIGFIFQQFMLIPRLSVQENVGLPLLYGRYSRRDRKERVEKALDQVGLLHKKKELPTKLSGGQKQRVAIARAIASEPQLLLADEPTGNLDVDAKQGVIDILHSLHKSGKTIVLVTHDHDLAQIADRILYVENRTLVSPDKRMIGGGTI
ncbi:ABC transporter ATP-binding protein [Aneurinibacillus tyrosinisolvens]|uniref:ABC transporter ATP-binding protein n=1 Tax=Aneurinibacillus tyrosinisolvens TaxID=1443435 RepID=UPI00063F618C|nr:ABC transporter ATP-binding protein [Aneurinibacillus tyrosinisolvens]